MEMDLVIERCKRITSAVEDLDEMYGVRISQILAYLEDSEFNAQDVLMGISIANGVIYQTIDISEKTLPFLELTEVAVEELMDEFGEDSDD